MAALILAENERAVLARLVGTQVRQLVWDLNAVYFVGAQNIVKVEAFAGHPDSPQPSKYDEAMHLRVIEHAEPQSEFIDGGEEGYWYRVISKFAAIESIEIVRTAILMPSGEVMHPDSVTSGLCSNLCDCGILVTTSGGVLPATQLNNCFGFSNWVEARRLHTRLEIETRLRDHYKICQL